MHGYFRWDSEHVCSFLLFRGTETNYMYRFLVDEPPDGPLIWPGIVRGYIPPPMDSSTHVWEPASKGVLDLIEQEITPKWFARLVELWSQEGDESSPTLRIYHIYWIKHLGMPKLAL